MPQSHAITTHVPVRVPADGEHVVVVGSGIIGAALAYALVRRGARVTLLDKAGPATATTPVAFAWIESQAYFRNGHSLSELASRGYFELHRFGFGAWRQLHAEIGDTLGVLWHGAVQISAKGTPDAQLQNNDLARRQRWGSPSYPVTMEQVRGIVPGIQLDDDNDAFVTIDEGHVDPAVATRAIVDAACARGARLHAPCTVEGVEERAGKAVGVRTSTGVVECDQVVYTCGTWSPQVLDGLDISVPLVPSQGALVHLAPMPRFLDPVLMTSNVHALQRFDGRVVIARHYSGSPVSDPGNLSEDELSKDAAAILPQLENAEIERVTVGNRIVPADGLPIIGHSPVFPNVHSITTNSGITLGPVLTQLMATEVLTGVRVEQLDPFRSTRFD